MTKWTTTMANGDPVAEAQKVLDQARWLRANMELEGDTTGTKIIDDLIALNRTLLEPLGDEGRELVSRLRSMTVTDTFGGKRLIPAAHEAAAYIERQSAALAARDERIRVLEEALEDMVDHYVGFVSPLSGECWEYVVVSASALLGEKP
jgi:hypothetical protein